MTHGTRKYEGTIRLQGIGVVDGIKAKNIKIGDELVWNFGGTSKVLSIEFSKTGKTLTIITEYVNYSGELETFERRLNAERIVAVRELNPVEEVEVEEIEEAEEVEVEEVDAVAEEVADLEALMVVKNEELEDVQKKIENAKSTEERHELRDIENELKWELCAIEEHLEVLERDSEPKRIDGYSEQEIQEAIGEIHDLVNVIEHNELDDIVEQMYNVLPDLESDELLDYVIEEVCNKLGYANYKTESPFKAKRGVKESNNKP